MERISDFFAPSLRRVRNTLMHSGPDAGSSPKDHVRTQLAGGVVLTVPLTGGNSLLKHRDIDLDQVMVSQHGDWQRRHLGAWQAIYGKTPYFPHLSPMIQEVYSRHSHGTFTEFSRAMYAIVEDFLDFDAIQATAVRLNSNDTSRLADIREETLQKCDIGLTIFDPLFRIGKNTVYLFI